MKQVFSKLLYGGGLLLLLMAWSMPAHAGPDDGREFTKTINKQYDIAPDGLVDLSNKYGQIDIKTWDQPQVRVSVKITVDASSEDRAQEVFDRISIDFYNNSRAVGATTEIATRKSSWWSWGDEGNEFSIKYEVFMPSGCSIEVDAKYCDVYVAAIGGEAELDVKYGNFKLDGLGENSDLVLAYGNGYVGEARDLALELSYANLSIEEAGDINISAKYGNLEVAQAGELLVESRYSQFNLGEVQEFRNEGKYDNVEIESADNIIVETHYTSVYVAQISNSMDLDMAYGAAEARMVGADFSEITLVGNYTDFKLQMHDDVRCAVELNGNHSDMRIPRDLDTEYDSQNGRSHEIRGTMGGGGNAIVKANLVYGGITLLN